MPREIVLTFDLTKDEDPFEGCETVADLAEKADKIEVVETSTIKDREKKGT